MSESGVEPAPALRPIAVFTTVASRDEARTIATALVSRRLAACVQIEAIDSVYVWQDALNDEAEFRLLVKTVAANYAAIEAAIRELHSYELPAIHAIAFDHFFPPYADWIVANSGGA